MDNSTATYSNSGSSLTGSYTLRDHAVAKSLAAGFNPANFDFVCVVINHNLYSFEGLGNIGAKYSWIDGNNSGSGKDQVSGGYIHELGHNLGLQHAGSWNPNTLVPDNPTGLTSEYGNPFDAMGNNAEAYSYDRLHFNASFKNDLDWLPDSYVTTPTTNVTMDLYAMDRTQVNGRKYAIKLTAGITLDGVSNLDYWVEFRSRYTGVDTI